jgi:hypothetical protein
MFEVAGNLDRLPSYDPVSGEHAWIVSALFGIRDPQARFTEGSATLDRENLLGISGVFCYHCEQLYSELLAEAPCDGEPVR